MSKCPCGSNENFSACCEPYIEGKMVPEYAEQLMRARYSAHTTANIQFIVGSHHPHTRKEIDEDTTKKWAQESTWMGIRIINVTGGSPNDTSGEVEFIATYRDGSGKRHNHHELSEFQKLDSKWYFKDAATPKISQFRREQTKIGRNDPCRCGSGKKYKKCCA